MKQIIRYGQVALFGTLSMGWHLGRIACCAPAYRKLSDTYRTFWAFAAIYLLAGLLRHCLVGSDPVLATALKLIAYSSILCLLFKRSNRSIALVAALLGCSTVVDLLASAGALFGVVESSAFWGPVEMVLVIAAVVQFHRAPIEVQQKRYGRLEVC